MLAGLKKKSYLVLGGWLFLLLTSNLFLNACSDSSPTPANTPGVVVSNSTARVSAELPTATPGSIASVGATGAVTPGPTVSDDYDPNVAYTPGSIVSSTSPGPPVPRQNLNSISSPTPNYGKLPTPPRSLGPRPATSPITRAPLAKGNFVVATSTGLYVLNPNGQDDYALVTGTAFSTPKISPDGTRIAAFRTDPINLKSQLCLIEIQSGNLQRVGGDGGFILNYSWSPDSKMLALTRTTDSNSDGLADENDKLVIWLYDVASSKQQQIGEGRNPAWSPDGVRLAYVIPGPSPAAAEIDPTTRKLRRNPNSVGIYNVQSSTPRNLISAKGLEVALSGASDDPGLKGRSVTLRYFKEVSWHPNSKNITVTADATGPNGLRLGLVATLTLEAPNLRLLTVGGEAALRSSWSPDGKKLVFETEPQYPLNSNSGPTLALLDNPDLTAPHPTRLFLGDPALYSSARAPLWINNGQQLAFLKSERSILSLVEADGKNERALISACVGFDWY